MISDLGSRDRRGLGNCPVVNVRGQSQRLTGIKTGSHGDFDHLFRLIFFSGAISFLYYDIHTADMLA